MPISTLTVTGTLVNDDEKYGQPTIWLVNGQGKVTGGPETTIQITKPDNTVQTQYYMVAGNEVAQHSTYKFTFAVPANITSGNAVTIPLTFGPDEVKDKGYDSVRFAFSNESTTVGTVTFKATDTSSTEHTFTNTGVWGPDSGFPINKDHKATEDWKITFSAAGTYTIKFSLVDKSNNDAIIVAGSTEVTVTGE